MELAPRSTPKKADILSRLGCGLLALLIGLPAADADHWSTTSARSSRNDDVEFVFDPMYPFPPEVCAKKTPVTAPDEKVPGEQVPGDDAPKPSDVFLADTGSPGNQREVLPSVVPTSVGGVAFRAGWWDVNLQGSPTMVGMYQGLTPSPFWDLALLKSDGVSTIDLYGTGLDNDTSQAGLYLFTPWYEANVRYERFLHRLEHDPLTNIPPPSSGAEIVAEDMNVGDDFAVRIQDFRTDVGGRLSDNLKYNVDVWIRRKTGERQALGTHHGMASGGFPCRVCHIVSQRQEIDWMTTRVEPSVEAKIGEVTVEYSRPMRFFGQNDSIVTRSYGSFHPYNDYTTASPYAVVPETVWQSDRLKVRTELPLETSFFSQAFYGTTENLQRDTDRRLYGFDVRLSNSYFDRLTLGSYFRTTRQLNQFPPFLVPPENITTTVPTAVVPPYNLRTPIDYLRTATGANADWNPIDSGGLWDQWVLNAGIELGTIGRSNAEYQIENPPGFVSQDHTSYVSYTAGTSMRWHPSLDNRLRYNHRDTAYPLYGVDGYYNVFNTNRPTTEDIVVLDTTWLAADNLMTTASISAANRSNHSSVANFDENDYPMTFTFWYAPRPNWSVSGGYGFFSNWIDQDIYVPGVDPEVIPLNRQQWNYGGRGQVASIGGSYAWTERLTLTAQLQEIWGTNAIDPLALWPDLTTYSDVRINTRRYTCGIDWIAKAHTSAYLRYIFEEFDDVTSPYYTGSAHMILAGLTATR